MITSEFKIISQSVPPRFDGFVIAHVSDLHNREFDGELIGKTSLVNPDIIVITGDMIHREDETDAAEKFALGAVQLAPVYYVTGNHEKVLSCYPAFADRLTSSTSGRWRIASMIESRSARLRSVVASP